MKKIKKLTLLTLSSLSLLSCGGVTSPAYFSIKAENIQSEERYQVNNSIIDDFNTFNFDVLGKFNDDTMKKADGTQVLAATLINFRPSLNRAYSSLIYAYFPSNSAYKYFYLSLSATNELGDIFNTSENELMPLDLVDTYDNFIRLALRENNLYKDFLSFFNKSKSITITIDLISALKPLESANDSSAAHGLSINNVFKFNRNISDLNKSNAVTSASSTGLNVEQSAYSSAYNVNYNIELTEPHVWSYRFDQDGTGANLWEAFKSLFRQGGDDLNDQVFYSFKMPNGWSKYEINNINLKYKTLLTIGSSYDLLSNQETYDYFEFNPTSESDMTIWNPSTSPGSSIEQNTWPGCSYYLIDYNKIQNMNATEMASYYIQTIASGPIGYTFEAAKNSDKYTSSSFIEESIKPEKAHTNIGSTSYEWNKIQTSAAFKEVFKSNQDILNFANQYMPTDDYQVINIAEVLYQYSNKYFSFSGNEYKDNTLENVPDIYKAFYNYLLENGIAVKSYEGISGMGYYLQEFIYFTMVRFCDVQATSMELTNSAGESYVVNVSVEPVDEENSGGQSEDPIGDFLEQVKDFFSNAKNVLKVILIGAGILIGLAILGWIINLFKSKK